MTEHEEAVGRQRIKELKDRRGRLIELETNMAFLFSGDSERLARAQGDHGTGDRSAGARLCRREWF